LAHSFQSRVLGAMAAQGLGAVALAEGDATAALPRLRHAWQEWRAMNAPYEAARARVLVGLACRRLGDDEGAIAELEHARSELERLGAVPDLAQLDTLTLAPPAPQSHGLTPRE